MCPYTGEHKWENMWIAIILGSWQKPQTSPYVAGN